MVVAILMVVIGCLGPLCFVGFFRGVVPGIIATRKGQTAQGTIVDIKSEQIEYRTVRRPIIQFSTTDGQRIQYKDAMAPPDGFHRGDTVTVHYDPRKPRITATVGKTGRAVQVGFAALFLSVLMTGFLVWGVLMLAGLLPLPSR